MRTTIDLPDELFRQVKAQAALEGRKLKDLIAEYVQRGLQRAPATDLHVSRHASAEEIRALRRSTPLPTFPGASTGKTIPALSAEELALIEEEEDLARLRGSGGC